MAEDRKCKLRFKLPMSHTHRDHDIHRFILIRNKLISIHIFY